MHIRRGFRSLVSLLESLGSRSRWLPCWTRPRVCFGQTSFWYPAFWHGLQPSRSSRRRLSRGAATDHSHGRSGVLLNCYSRWCASDPLRSLRSRLPLTRGRLTAATWELYSPPLCEGESRRRRQGVAHTPSGIRVGQHSRRPWVQVSD